MVDILCSLSLASSLEPRPAVANPASSAPDIPPCSPTLQEMFVSGGDAAAIGLALSQLAPLQLRDTQTEAQTGPLLWVQDRQAIREMGRVFLHGLPHACGRDVVHVAAKDGREVLWAMAEGLKCAGLHGVIGEIHGDPRALDFTATRRLAVAAERYGVPAFLMRVNGHADLSGARRRWRVESRPSLPHPHDGHAPGAPTWSLDMFRARDLQPHVWDVSYDREAHRVDLVPAAGDGSLEENIRLVG